MLSQQTFTTLSHFAPLEPESRQSIRATLPVVRSTTSLMVPCAARVSNPHGVTKAIFIEPWQSNHQVVNPRMTHRTLNLLLTVWGTVLRPGEAGLSDRNGRTLQQNNGKNGVRYSGGGEQPRPAANDGVRRGL